MDQGRRILAHYLLESRLEQGRDILFILYGQRHEDTLSAWLHGTKRSTRNHKNRETVRTRRRNSHCSLSGSSKFIHSSGSATHSSISDELNGMKRVTISRTASSTNSWDKASMIVSWYRGHPALKTYYAHLEIRPCELEPTGQGFL
jgi:hypothetical protein